MFSLILLLILFFLLSVKSFVVSRCIILGVCTVVEDSSSGRLSNKYWAVWVETLRPAMSKINHHTASTGRGSAEINQAEKRLTGKGIESVDTQELTHQPLHECGHSKRLARELDIMLHPQSIPPAALSLLFLFLLSLSLFLYLSVPTAASDKTNKSQSYISCPTCLVPLPSPHGFSSLSVTMPFSWCIYLLLLSYVCSHRDLFCFARVLQQQHDKYREDDILSLRALDLVKMTFMWYYFSHLSKYLPCKDK